MPLKGLLVAIGKDAPKDALVRMHSTSKDALY